MATAEERLMEWLRDAHAAEEQAVTMLSGMADRIDNYPKLKKRIQQHVRQTEGHAKLVLGCIERRGGSRSVLKDTGAKMLGFGQAISGILVGDEVMKGSIASYAFEAMEIVSYRILISAAKEVGDERTARICARILREEVAMAHWLEANITGLTRQYLKREETPGATAKH
jgi:ferritin-like metal-binding protein YciE